MGSCVRLELAGDWAETLGFVPACSAVSVRLTQNGPGEPTGVSHAAAGPLGWPGLVPAPLPSRNATRARTPQKSSGTPYKLTLTYKGFLSQPKPFQHFFLLCTHGFLRVRTEVLWGLCPGGGRLPCDAIMCSSRSGGWIIWARLRSLTGSSWLVRCGTTQVSSGAACALLSACTHLLAACCDSQDELHRGPALEGKSTHPFSTLE